MINTNNRILIVDDQIENLQAIYKILDQAAISKEISLANSVKQAYQVIESQVPDLIITDWEMSDINGIEFITALKEDDTTKDIPVIMCTGVMTSSKNLEIALEAGAADYVRKPVDSLELIARVKANLHLSEKYQEIKKLNESKETLFSIISHDLRGSIGRIKSLADIAKMSKGSFGLDDVQNFIELIGQQSKSAFTILENLLQWAKSQRNQISINIQTQVINDIILENIELLEGLANNKKISIKNLIPNSLEVPFDLNMLSIVFRNLIENAIKFTPENGIITLEAKIIDSLVTFSVQDTGVGIPEERLETIFNKTNFETTFGTENESGSGLGLKLCQDFIEKHQGKIWVESEIGKGSKFSFSIPLKQK